MMIGGYRPQLDGLRALALLVVLLGHYWTGGIMGHVAVRLFFVLSGFLITQQLLAARGDGEGAGRALWPAIRNFYARRILRLWPAYFVLIALLLIIDWRVFRPYAAWHALFASNILFSLKQDFLPWYTAHWWTLAVEEQFYLIWPFIMLLPPRRWIVPIAASAIAASWAYRLFDLVVPVGDPAIWMLLPAAMDALGGGALLAIFARSGAPLPRWALPVAVASALVPTILYLGDIAPRLMQIYDGMYLPALMMGVAGAARGFSGPVGRLMEWGPLRHMGRISYAAYLWHLPVLAGMLAFSDRVPGLGTLGPATFLIGTALTIVVASLSWVAIERPANRLKHRFRFPPREAALAGHPRTS